MEMFPDSEIREAGCRLRMRDSVSLERRNVAVLVMPRGHDLVA